MATFCFIKGILAFLGGSVKREKRLLIGFNLAGNPLEIIYNELDDGRINVFHAMPCRTKYTDYLNKRENL